MVVAAVDRLYMVEGTMRQVHLQDCVVWLRPSLLRNQIMCDHNGYNDIIALTRLSK